MDLLYKFLLIIGRLPLLLWLRQLTSNTPCLTADEVVRFQKVERQRKFKELLRSADFLIAKHDFSRSRLEIGIPANCKDITVSVCNAYLAAGFDSKWLGNPNKEEEVKFPHVIYIQLRENRNELETES